MYGPWTRWARWATTGNIVHLFIINTSILLVLALVLDILSGGRLLIILDLECLLVSLHQRVFLK